MENASRSRKHMNRCSRLSLMIVVPFWAFVSPLVVSTEANRGPELSFQYCTDSTYQQYGSTLASVQHQYIPFPRLTLVVVPTHAKAFAFRECSVQWLPLTDRVLGLAGWGFMLYRPLCYGSSLGYTLLRTQAACCPDAQAFLVLFCVIMPPAVVRASKKAAKAFAAGYRHTFAGTWGLKGSGLAGVAAANSC